VGVLETIPGEGDDIRRKSLIRRGILAASLTVAFSLPAGAAIAAEGVNPDADEIIAQDGQKLQLNSDALVVLERPSRSYISRQGGSSDSIVSYDGSKLTAYSKIMNAYVQKDFSGTNDDSFAAIESGTGLNLPGSDLLLSAPYAVLASGVTGSGYYGMAYVQGVESPLA
jgi:hypothetical protein